MFPFLDSLFNKPKVIDVAHERRNISNLAAGLGAIFLLSQLFQTIAGLFLGLFFSSYHFSYVTLLLISSGIMYFVAMPLSMAFFGECDVHPVKKRKMDAGTLIGLIFLCLALMHVGSVIGSFIDDLTMNLMGESTGDPLGDTVAEIPLWAIFLLIVVMAPIFEEIFYRGVVINRLRRYGDGTAIVVSGLIFGLIHGNFNQFFYATFVGMVLAAVYLHTGKLSITIFLHMVVNFMETFYISVMIEKFGGEIPAVLNDEVIEAYPVGVTMLSAYSLIYVLSLIVAIPMLIHLIKETRRRLSPAEVSLQGSQRFQAVFCNLGFWFAVIMIGGNFVTNLLPA
jgi:membrane protease YdiL (CAAX protease family)